MSIELALLIATSSFFGLIVLFYTNRRRFLERRAGERRVVMDRRLYQVGRRAQDTFDSDSVDESRIIRRTGVSTRRQTFRRKEDRLSAA